MKCLHCCSELTLNVNFCSNCGNRVLNCSRCRYQIEKTDKFCRHCGFENNKDTCPRCHSLLPETDKFCKICGLENTVLCQKEQPVDGNCNTDSYIWYPTTRDICNPENVYQPNIVEGSRVSHTEKPVNSELCIGEQSANAEHGNDIKSQEFIDLDLCPEEQPVIGWLVIYYPLEKRSESAKTTEDISKRKSLDSGRRSTRPDNAKMRKDTIMLKILNLEQKLTNHKQQRISLAITGDTYVGKSSFINLILNYNEEDENFAKTGDGNTTLEPEIYSHPRNENFTITDMPGHGTLKIPTEKIEELVKLSQFDYVLIFFHPVLREVDMRMAEILKEHNIPFALVRTKLDLDLEKVKPEDTAKTIIPLRKQLRDEIKGDKQFDRCKIYLISTEPALLTICDLTSLISDIADKLGSKKKYEAFLLQIGILNPVTIRKKYKELMRRIFKVELNCGLIESSWFYHSDVCRNYNAIVDELNLYVQSFCLDKEYVRSIPGLKSPFSRSEQRHITWQDLTNQGFGQIAQGALAVAETGPILSVLGKVSPGFDTAHKVNYLMNHLQELRQDALTVYKYFIEKRRG